MEEYIVGQPKSGSKRKQKLIKDVYQLGRATAANEQKKREIEQGAQMTLVQRLLLQEAGIQMKDMMAELKRMQDDVKQRQLMASLPPPLPEPPAQSLPMLPEPPAGMMGGGPSMGGPPPDMMGGGMSFMAPPPQAGVAPPVY